VSCGDQNWCGPCPSCENEDQGTIIYPIPTPAGGRIDEYLCIRCFTRWHPDEPGNHQKVDWHRELEKAVKHFNI